MVTLQIARDIFVLALHVKDGHNFPPKYQLSSSFQPCLENQSQIICISLRVCGPCPCQLRLSVSCRRNRLANLNRIFMEKIMGITEKCQKSQRIRLEKWIEKGESMQQLETELMPHQMQLCENNGTAAADAEPHTCQLPRLPLLAPSTLPYIFTVLLLLLLPLSPDPW